MALRTADEYKKGLKDDRVVYMLGEKVSDVTEDPYLKVGVETGAQDFLMAHEPEYRDLAVAKDPDTGEDISRYFELPNYAEQIKKRFDLILAGCRYDNGEFIPYIKDVGTDALNALYVVSNMMGDETYIERVKNFRNICARQDLSLALAMTDAKGDRSKGPSDQVHPDYYVHVVDESKDEIVVKGAKAHITAAPYVDEILVLPTRNMTEASKDYAVAFAVRPDAPGVKQLCRASFRYEDNGYFPTPHPRRGHIESIVVFDNVRIPKERVFLCGEWQFARQMAYAFATFHRMTGATYKIPILELMTGLGMLIAEMNGVHKAAHVREMFTQMITYTETLKALTFAAAVQPENVQNMGIYAPNRLVCNMAKYHFASNFHDFIRNLQDITGGILVTQPTYKDYQNPEIKPYMDHYLGGNPSFTSEERMRLLSLLHHYLAADFSGWHESATLHGEGSMAAQKMMIMTESPLEYYRKLATGVLGIDK